MLIEGMIIVVVVVGVIEGYIYVCFEYLYVIVMMNDVIVIVIECGYLGDDIFGFGKFFWLEVCKGVGVYICGEEIVMLESLEGKCGVVCVKLLLFVIEGLFGKLIVINNLILLVLVLVILVCGVDFYKNYGVGCLYGMLFFQLVGNIKQGGLVEKVFGFMLCQLLEDFGGGSVLGCLIWVVQMGGLLGVYLLFL